MGNIKPYSNGYKTTTNFFDGIVNPYIIHSVKSGYIIASSTGYNGYNFTSSVSGVNVTYHTRFFQVAGKSSTIGEMFEPMMTIQTSYTPSITTNSLVLSLKVKTNKYFNIYIYPENNTFTYKIGFASNNPSNANQCAWIGAYGLYQRNYPSNLPLRGMSFGLYKHTDGNVYIGTIIDVLYNNADLIYFSGLLYSEFLTLSPEVVKISDTFGEPSKPEGYNPTFDTSSDTIAIPSIPSIGVTSGGFLNAYKVTTGALDNMANELFPQVINPIIEGDGSFKDIATSLYALLQSYMNKGLIDYVLDCHIIPCVPSAGASENVRVGYRTLSTTTGGKLTSDYVDVSCGSLSISEFYGNFIDYLTNFKLYLPFVGFIPLKPEFVQNGTIRVDYRFNVIDGSFMCFVRSSSSKSELSDTVIGTYSGNCCVHIPISGQNYATMFNGVLSNGATAVTSAISGNVGGIVTSALNTMSAKPSFEQSNSYNGTSAFLSPRTPYLLIERPMSNMSEKAPHEHGLPLNVTMKISELSGFTVIEKLDIEGLSLYDEEKEELMNLFERGVVL